MGRIVIVGYKPKPGCEAELEALCITHHPRLLAEDLVTDRAPVLMRATDGTIVEVFEWKSDAAMASAHSNPAVLQMWEEYAACSDYIPLKDLAETSELFATFAPIDD